ncbi:Endoribonuclease ZC3H12A [Gracilariopsis chorda]|uniref:Endoribonuclease ZC3H12A n=1 Tax=Gracilariopsis chorda TaxID=448386 RepID=A0A2V3J436_9FLOR|nr:Endoribonuclease ZC3H12A [Gracilariopsis chorda]|eukprot:PXF49178.1 Endoribonuclease ZC3H12A [Gracilariopsis chorda]
MEADAMEIDSAVQPSSHLQHHTPVVLPNTTDGIVDAALALLRTHLYRYIIRQLLRSVGQEFLEDLAPHHDAALVELLKFVLDKWLSTFTDSSLANHKSRIERLITLVKAVQPTPRSPVLAPSLITAKETLQAVETLLVNFHPPAAAHIEALAKALSAKPTTTTTNTNITPRAKPPSHPSTTPSHSLQSNHHPQPTLSIPDAPLTQPISSTRIPVVLDGSNIAWRHGNSRFSIRGVVLAFRHFYERSHPIVLFLPEARLRNPSQDSDFNAVNSLRGTSYLVLTPDTDYDDAYICDFARDHAAVVVSNDAFKDHAYQASAISAQEEQLWKTWLTACRLSFTFRADQFLPNPAFNYERAAKVASSLRRNHTHT